MKTIIFRCRSMTTDEYHHIEVPEAGYITCSCKGENWCSHIEATLLAGERAMVPAEDHKKANQAQVLLKGKIQPPENWKSNWRKNKRWRGIATGETKAMQLTRKGNPVVSLQGKGKIKKLSKRVAIQNGWIVVAQPTKGVIIHVSDDPDECAVSKHAESLGITIISHEQWPNIAPMGHTLKDRMRDLLKDS